MNVEAMLSKTSERELAEQLYKLVTELFPICRSITGDGVRETLAILQQQIPLEVHEVPTGTQVFDWEVPNEWNIRDAYIKDASGHRVVDFQQSNLHVLNYSAPFKGRVKLNELKEHLYSLPDQPEVVPYRTSYYQQQWGFCLSQQTLNEMSEEAYDVCVDASLEPGSLTYGELFIPGQLSDEVLISCHICHPSLANDNLSGVAIATLLGKWLATQQLRHSYRILFVPGTIGAITWLAQNENRTEKVKHGLVLAGLGDAGGLTFKKSRRGNTKIDQAAALVVGQQQGEVFDFSPYGYDERQYCSPGFDLPVGRLSRTPFGTFPEYHTSDDNLSFVKPMQLAGSLQACVQIFEILEKDATYLNTQPKCEPRLSKYGLYGAVGGLQENPDTQMALLWLLNLSDGQHSLLDIAVRSKVPFSRVVSAAEALCRVGLLEKVG